LEVEQGPVEVPGVAVCLVRREVAKDVSGAAGGVVYAGAGRVGGHGVISVLVAVAVVLKVRILAVSRHQKVGPHVHAAGVQDYGPRGHHALRLAVVLNITLNLRTV